MLYGRRERAKRLLVYFTLVYSDVSFVGELSREKSRRKVVAVFFNQLFRNPLGRRKVDRQLESLVLIPYRQFNALRRAKDGVYEARKLALSERFY